MKFYSLLALSVGLMASAWVLPAKAQDDNSVESRVNCDALTGTPDVCVFNNSKSAIRVITCDNSGWTGPKEYGMMVPRGSIPAGKMTIVKFDDKGDCSKGLHVTTADGHIHNFVGQDTKTATVLSIDTDGSW